MAAPTHHIFIDRTDADKYLTSFMSADEFERKFDKLTDPEFLARARLAAAAECPGSGNAGAREVPRATAALKIGDVTKRTGLGRSTIYEMIKADTFTKSLSLGPKRVVWYEHEVEDWMKSRPRS